MTGAKTTVGSVEIPPELRTGRPARPMIAWVVLVVTAIACFLAMNVVSDPLLIGGVGLIQLLVLMALRIPVAVALAVSGVAGIWAIAGASVVLDSLTSRPFIMASSWSLSVLPMFILMSYLLANSGATTRIYNAARAWLGWAPGGLALTTNFAGAGFSAISGSSVTIAYALGRVGLPEMLRSGYSPRLALGTVMMSGTMGNLIPPSILLVVYAGIAEVPIGPALIAGLIPGILLALLFAVLIVGLVLVKPSLAGGQRGIRIAAVDPKLSRGKTALEVVPVLVIVLLVVGGIYNGFFTATEAGAVGVVAAAILALVYTRRRFGKVAVTALSQAAVSTASIFILLIGAQIFNRMLTLSGVARWVSDGVAEIATEPLVFILIAAAILLVLGCFMESTSILLITVPLLLPAVLSLGIDPIWFGVFAVLVVEIGLVTPPLGLLSYAVHSIAQNPDVNLGHPISLGEVFRSALMFLPAPVVLAVLLVIFPQLTSLLSVTP